MIGIILGSAFADDPPPDLELHPVDVETKFGEWRLHRADGVDRPAVVSFRHGLPHRFLPNQIPYRAQIAALDELGCESLVVTSSVGVLTGDLPLFEPLLVEDLVTMDNRLPDGSACTMFEEPTADQGHLVLDEGLFSSSLGARIETVAAEVGHPVADRATFGYVGGPRGKTRAENHAWRQLGAEINSMTVGPEVVLANELEIPSAALVVGHKYSLPDRTDADEQTIETSLDEARAASREIVVGLLEHLRPVEFGNHVYTFDE